MTRRQEDKLSMWTTTDSILSKYESVWPTLKAFEKAATLFRNIRLEIDPEAGIQQSSTVGITQDKMVARRRLVALTRQTTLNIEAYAMAEDNFSLEKEFSFIPSYFDTIRDNALPILANTTITRARELVDKLEPYGVSANSIKELSDALTEYGLSNASPRVAVGRRKTATANIAAKITEGTRQLQIMDRLIGNFSKEYPEFVAAFQNARMIISSGTRSKKDTSKPAPPKAN